MKKIFLALLTLAVFSCKEEEINPQQAIYKEWKWALTTFDTRGEPLTAQEQDTTWYFRFQQNGILELRDFNRELKEQRKFEIKEGDGFFRMELTDSGITWGYSVKNDTLRIWDPFSIWPQTDIFIAD